MIRNYCSLGINHHLIYPGVLDNAKLHEETLQALVQMNEFQVVDLSLPEDRIIRGRETVMLKQTGKEIIYNFPLFFLGENDLDPNSDDPDIIERTLEKARQHLEYAAQAGAKYVTFASGIDQGISKREKLRENFIQYSCLFGKEAEKYKITALIEPFDRSIGKNLVIGPTREAVEYIKSLHELGIFNIALMVDMGHVPLMGDTFEEAIMLSLPYLHHIHIGNCVMKNPESTYYGDKHPPLGIDSGENDMPELEEFLSILLKSGYMENGGKRSVSIEMQPYPGVSSQLSALVGFEKMNNALHKILKCGEDSLCN